jgi:hypothetical protein
MSKHPVIRVGIASSSPSQNQLSFIHNAQVHGPEWSTTGMTRMGVLAKVLLASVK